MEIKQSFGTFLIVLMVTGKMFGQGTSFTYQGRLSQAGNPISGNYDLEFMIFDALTNGNQIGVALTNLNVSVSGGLFTAAVNFGPIFSGTNYWLQIGVRSNGGGNFTVLTPRQTIAPTPYAIMANSASNLLGQLPVAQLNGVVSLANLPTNYSASISNSSSAALESFGYTGQNVGNDNSAWLAAAASGKTVVLTGPSYLLSTNIVLGVGTSLIGRTIIHVNTSVSGLAIDTVTNYANGEISGFTLDGQKANFTGNGNGDYVSGATLCAWHFTLSSDPEQCVIAPAFTVRRDGLRIFTGQYFGGGGNSLCTNVLVKDLTISGFAGIGFSLNGNGNYGGFYLQPTLPTPAIYDIRSYDNWIGITSTNGAEYVSLIGDKTMNNGIGVYQISGNDMHVGHISTTDACAVYLDGQGVGNNTLHGGFYNCFFNHCNFAIRGGYCPLGEDFVGCIAQGGDGITGLGSALVLVNMGGFQWTGGYMNPTHIKFDGNDGGYVAASNIAMNVIHTKSSRFNPATIVATNNGALLELTYTGLMDTPNTVSTNSLIAYQFNNVSNVFSGKFVGDGSGLTGLSNSGITTNLQVTVGGSTRTLYFTNGILGGVGQP